MKKAISLLLVLVVCLSLCACGKSEAVKNVEALIDALGEVTVDSETAIVAAEEAYKALIAEEQNKVANATKLADARETFEELKYVGELQATVDKYSEVIDALDAEKFEDAIVIIRGMQTAKTPVETKAEPEEIQITTDNWSDYFEIRQYDQLTTNAFGEYTEFRIQAGIFLKEEYCERLCNNSEVSFEVQSDYCHRTFSFDTTTGEYHIGDIVSNYAGVGTETEIVSAETYHVEGEFLAELKVAGIDKLSMAKVALNRNFDADKHIRVYENHQVLRATGTLYLNK